MDKKAQTLALYIIINLVMVAIVIATSLYAVSKVNSDDAYIQKQETVSLILAKDITNINPTQISYQYQLKKDFKLKINENPCQLKIYDEDNERKTLFYPCATTNNEKLYATTPTKFHTGDHLG